MQTPKQQAASQRRRLKSIKAKLDLMSADWCDVDHFFMSRFDEISKEIETLDSSLAEFITDGDSNADQ